MANGIDVCHRERPADHQVNARAEGAQLVESDRAVVPMPSGGAFVAFTSTVSGDPNDAGRSEIRGTLLGVDGSPQPTFEATDELTYAPAVRAAGSLDDRSQPSVVPPDRGDGHGAIVFSWHGEESSHVVAEFIRGSGAPLGPDRDSACMVVSAASPLPCRALGNSTEPGPLVGDPIAVPLGPTEPHPSNARDFAFFWIAALVEPGSNVTTIRGRLVRARFGVQEALTVWDGTGTGPVDLVAGAPIVALTAVPAGEGRTLLVWQETEAANQVITRARVFDERLLPTDHDAAPVTLGRSHDGLPGFSSIAAARGDDGGVLIAWTERRPGDVDCVVARLVDEAGAARDSGEARVLVPSEGVQSRPAVTALRGGGYAVAWGATDDPAHEDPSGWGVRMVLLDEAGRVIFANWACDHADFQLNQRFDGDQNRPALTTLHDGTVVGVWNGVDISTTGVRSIALRRSVLLPLRGGQR